MTTQPQLWHYGLVAEYWANFHTNTPELSYYQSQIERFGQPVLDLGCGVGRLLLPLLQGGIDIDGCDISPDMIEQCRLKVAAAGLSTHLTAQPMHDFTLPRRYRTIYICDSFGLAGSREANLETVRRCYHHLEPGGALIVNIAAEYELADDWNDWLKDTRDAMPNPWPAPSAPRQAADGSKYRSRTRFIALDPLEQSYIREMHVEKWQDDLLVAEERYTLKGYMFFNNEMLLMLQLAGFTDVLVQGNYTEEPATADHGTLVYIARKQL